MRILDRFFPAFFSFLLLFAYFIYEPGFSAGFIFDDIINLSKFVELRTGVEGLWQFFRYTERPLAFLSFMFNDNKWPSTPEGFIQTNVLLHLFCSCLLLFCFILIGENLGWKKRKCELIAMYAAFIWLIHPLFVSTTLYIVQRMTILSAIFVLLSLISYLYGRLQLVKGEKKGWFWLIFATPGFGLLGLLSKENAALIPFYLLAFEITIFAKEKQITKYYLFWKKSFIYLPILIMVASVFIFMDSWINTYYLRDFSLGERLLTQANILMYYLFIIIIPKTSTNGLHYENYPISTSLIEPWTTLPAVACVIGIIIFSIVYRKKYPALAFSILFFFFGHLMESTFIALELYFEHRNYLPSMMFFFVLSYGLFQCYEKYRRAVVLVAATIVLTLSSVTYARTELWGNQLLLLSVWTEKNPGSYRNYIEGHIRAHGIHRYDLAVEFLDRGIKNMPNNVHLQIGYVGYGCGAGTIDRSDIDRLKVLIAETKSTSKDHLYKNLTRLMDITFSSRCEFITYDDLRDIFTAALKNPNMMKHAIRLHEIMHLMGRLELELKNYLKAKDAFLQSFRFNRHPSVALQQVALLGTHEQYDLAYDYLIETKGMIYGGADIELREEMLGWNDFVYMESVLLEELKIKSIDK